MFILKPDVSEEELKAKAAKIKKLITDAKGEILKEDVWGRRNLAYPINRFSEGFYHLMNIRMPEGGVVVLERSLRLDEDLLRFLVARSG